MKNLKVNLILVMILVGLIQSCEKDDFVSENVISKQSQIVKEFDIEPSWFNDSTTLKSGIIGDIYSNFGEGIDVVKNEARHSVFDVQTSLKPLVATTIEEKTTMRYTATNSYREVDSEVKTELAAALGIDVWKVELDANLSVTNSTKITEDAKSILR